MFVKLVDGKVHLKRKDNGVELIVPLEKLITSDRLYATRQAGTVRP
jgi:hypothetical protein